MLIIVWIMDGEIFLGYDFLQINIIFFRFICIVFLLDFD